MPVSERAAFLCLLRQHPGRWAAITEQVEESGSALEVLSGISRGQQRLFPADLDASSLLIEEVEAEIVGWEKEGMHLATLLDPDYPVQLLSIHQRPPFVMWRGTQDPRDAEGVAIVGTRKASPEGLSRAKELAGDLASRHVTVISGLAAGIDSAAHLGALEAGGRTVAVVGTGLRRSYPRQNAALQSRIGEQGMVLSQFLPDAPPTKQSFPMRNAVMSGYGAATVVIEAAWKSGARMQARLALQHGRSVFLLRSLLEHDWARDYAKRPGATVVDGVDDVVERLKASTLQGEELSWA
jgi:DNA processing protein